MNIISVINTNTVNDIPNALRALANIVEQDIATQGCRANSMGMFGKIHNVSGDFDYKIQQTNITSISELLGNTMKKESLESLVQKTFVGKIFLRSEFHDAGDPIYGLRRNKKIGTIDDLIGKKIIYATPVSMQVRRGVGLQFEGVDFDELIGFYANCQITISD